MQLNNYFNNYFDVLTHDDISEKNSFNNYDNFKNFIINHYNLDHLESNNYIKYVKVKRQILILEDKISYDTLLSKINSIIRIMNISNIFPNINIKKYLFKINTIFKLINDKKNILTKNIYMVRNLHPLKMDSLKVKLKTIQNINSLLYKYKIYNKYSKELINYINELIELEKIYNIDHHLIELNNIERSFLGKKSEYSANEVIFNYIHILNNNSDKKYFYEINIDIIKLLNININHESNIKGEADGMIISYDGKDYIIEKIIEVKSSIKATFEDIKKFTCLKNYIKDLIDNNISYGQYIFTKNSFVNILNKNISDWTIYICINDYEHNIIEKSHLYFSTVLKIIDDNFIKEFYIEKNEKIIKEKYKIIENNTTLIDNMFNEWKTSIKLGSNECNVYIKKY